MGRGAKMNKKELKAIKFFIEKRIGKKGDVSCEEIGDAEIVNTLTDIKQKYSDEQIAMEFRKARLWCEKQMKKAKKEDE